MSDQNEGVDILALAQALGWSAADLRLLGDLRDMPRYMEAEIERRGLWHAYVNALLHEIGCHTETIGFDAVVSVIRATPEQRARAFLEAVRAM